MLTLRSTGMWMVAGVLAMLAWSGRADTRYWNQFDGVARSFNTAANWVGGVPGASDTAAFTNWGHNFTLTWGAATVNQAAYFDAVDQVREVRPGGAGSASWTVTDALTIGNSGLNTASMRVYAQQIAVTNAAGSATLKVNWGTAGKGRLVLYDNNAQVIADHLYASNSFGVSGCDVIDAGTLVTKGESTLASVAGTFYIGNWGGVLGTWRILGGTNTAWQTLNLGSAGVYGATPSVGTGVVEVIGSTAALEARSSVYVGAQSSGTGRLIVTNGASATLFGLTSLGTFGVGGNRVLVTGTNSILDTRGQVYLKSSTPDNVLRVEQGGTWKHNTANGLYFNVAGASTNNTVVIDGPGSSFVNWDDIFIGGGGGEQNGKGWLIVQNGATASTPSYANIEVGYGTANTYGEIRVAGSGSAFLHPSGSFNVGVNGTGAVYVVNGGLLESIITVGANSKGLVMNDGGILQFFEVNPSLTVSTPGRLIVTNGTISFRGVTTVDVNGNVAGTKLTNASFYGNNAFRLNSATNAAAGQDYTFGVTADPRNYVRLELLNGSTYRGGNVTIGAGGSALFSNGIQTVSGSLTNLGAITVADGSLAIAGACYLAPNSTINMVSNSVVPSITVGGVLTLPANATFTYTGGLARDTALTLISAPAGITGTPANWTVNPPTHRLRVVGNTLVVAPRAAGFVIAIE